jgi:uncharacterized protein
MPSVRFEAIRARWDTDRQMAELKRFRVPDEDIKLTLDEVQVVQTRAFQRLFDLKQLGLAYLVYPAASHTRGTHSLQCLNEAQRILAALGIGEDTAAPVRMAALLHDIGHVPFSHTLEDEHQILAKHDRAARLDLVLEGLKSEVAPNLRQLIDSVTPILKGISGPKTQYEHELADGSKTTLQLTDWRSDLIGNTVCADLLAYIQADAAATGIEKRPGYYRIYDYFLLHPSKGSDQKLCIRLTKGGLRTDIVSAILDLLDMRYALTERVLFHHAKAIASAMLARAVRLVGAPSEVELITMGDEVFLRDLGDRAEEQGATGPLNLIQNLRARRLHKRVYRLQVAGRMMYDSGRAGAFCRQWRDGRQVEELLTGIENDLGMPRGTLSLWCPESDAAMKLARVSVVWDAENRLDGPAELRSDAISKRFPGVHERVSQIEAQYSDLWSFWVNVDRDWLHLAPEVVRALEGRLEVPCDHDFFATYVRKLPGFEQGWRRIGRVHSVLGPVEARVNRRLADQAAASGESADTLDPSVIIDTLLDEAEVAAESAFGHVQETMHDVIEPAERPRKRSRRADGHVKRPPAE